MQKGRRPGAVSGKNTEAVIAWRKKDDTREPHARDPRSKGRSRCAGEFTSDRDRLHENTTQFAICSGEQKQLSLETTLSRGLWCCRKLDKQLLQNESVRVRSVKAVYQCVGTGACRKVDKQ
ncbi:hypothetical protein PC119_g3634 [Phytophthora cactorum]|nr:hypothetical protein PC119_g3634 [Phytophthora cactorum]